MFVVPYEMHIVLVPYLLPPGLRYREWTELYLPACSFFVCGVWNAYLQMQSGFQFTNTLIATFNAARHATPPPPHSYSHIVYKHTIITLPGTAYLHHTFIVSHTHGHEATLPRQATLCPQSHTVTPHLTHHCTKPFTPARSHHYFPLNNIKARIKSTDSWARGGRIWQSLSFISQRHLTILQEFFDVEYGSD